MLVGGSKVLPGASLESMLTTAELLLTLTTCRYKAGLKEIGILDKLAGMDPEDKRHLVRLISHFEHRGHLCMVFESLRSVDG